MHGVIRESLDKFQTLQSVSSVGIVGIPQYTVKAESTIRVVLDSNAAGSTVDVYGRIGTAPFELIGSISGNTSATFDTATYDFIRFDCSVFSAAFILYASGFVPVSDDSVVTAIESLNPISTGVNTRPGITAVSSIALAANPDRKYASFFNQSGSVIYLKLGAAAVLNQGIRMPNNSIFEINADNLFTGAVHAITGAGTQNLDIFEGEL
jgi:hypothetical protein